ncbi:hypothetical protein HNP86_001594 [Methanococcus maripaludis]|uniref:Uncharacterized protein n=2 Tax=Methanococcus maripaludis TaxID=39152 RepID=A0A7J9NVU7_METMI|nr:hypothetical protein [Methanococcus maripaludis]
MEKEDRLEIVTQLANPNNLSKCEKLFNLVIPKKYKKRFQRNRIESKVVRYPEKRGYLNQTMGMEEHKKSQEIEENKRLELDE